MKNLLYKLSTILIVLTLFTISTISYASILTVPQGGTGNNTFTVGNCLVGNGTAPITTAPCSSGGITLETNNTTNGSQTLLNLVNGNNITLTDNGSGQITFDGSNTLYTGDGTTTGTRVVSYNDPLSFVDASTSKTGLFFDPVAITSTLGSDPINNMTRLVVDGNNFLVKILDGGFQIPTGATAGYVLTSDVNGTGTWQAAGIGSQNLQQVTDIGDTTDNKITLDSSGNGGSFDPTFSWLNFFNSNLPSGEQNQGIYQTGNFLGGTLHFATLADDYSTQTDWMTLRTSNSGLTNNFKISGLNFNDNNPMGIEIDYANGTTIFNAGDTFELNTTGGSYVWPLSQGTNSGQYLSNDGFGALSWADLPSTGITSLTAASGISVSVGSNPITSTGTITNDLITGKSGGQTIYGGTGSSEGITIHSNLAASNGIIQIGNNIIDEATSRVAINGSIQPTARMIVYDNGSGLTSSEYFGIEYSNPAQTFNTTSNDIRHEAGYFTSTGSRSAGANALTNVGIIAFAQSGQNNYAGLFPYGTVGIGGALSTFPTAQLHILNAVSTAAGSAQLKLQLGGTVMTTPEPGAIEATNTHIFWTSSAGTRFQLDQQGSGTGTVTSVSGSGGTTGLTLTGGPITTSGTLTLGGILAVANGGTGTITAFTPGSVVFAGTSGIYTQDNANYFWDDTNNRLGIGTASPSAKLDLQETGTGLTASWVGYNGSNSGSTFNTTAGVLTSTIGSFVNSSTRSAGANALTNIALTATASGAQNNYAGIFTGLVGIGQSIPTATLDIADTTLAGSGSLAGSALNITQTWNTSGAPIGIKLNVTNTGSGSTARLMSLQVGGVNSMSVTTNGQIFAGSNPNVGFGAATSSSAAGNIAGDGLRFFSNPTNTVSSYEFWFFPTGARNPTSGTNGGMNFGSTFSPTSGTATYAQFLLAPTINQTGGANGITRGLYINPTLTASADFRAIEVASGKSLFGGSVQFPIRTITVSATITNADYTILCDATAGNVVVTLPTAASSYDSTTKAGRIYNMKKIDASANSCKYAGAGGTETIDGATTYPAVGVTQYANYPIQSNGTAWFTE